MKATFYILLFTLLLEILNSCANPSSPQGGPRDTIPPSLVTSYPANNQLNFNGDRITLTFDEFINADKLKSSLVITPSTDLEFTHVVKKYDVIIKLLSELQDSTTYTFNFSTAITDVTEKNPADNVILSISTTSYIDSLSISGKVTDLLTAKYLPSTTVGLYQYSDTLDPTLIKPTYFSLSDDRGHFKITNIKNGSYKLLSFQDANNNLLLDFSEESHGFLSGILDLNSDLDSVSLVHQLIDGSDLKLDFTRPSGPYFDLKYSKALVDYTIQPIQQSDTLPYYQLIDNSSTLRFFNNLLLQDSDSLGLIVEASDTLEQVVLDTLYIKFNPSSRRPAEFTTSQEVTIQPSGKVSQVYTFSKPVVLTAFDSIQIYYDTILYQSLSPVNFTYNKDRTQINHNFQFDWNSFNTFLNSLNNSDSVATEINARSFNLVTKTAAFISIESDSSTSIRKTIKRVVLEDLGVIKGSIATNYSSFFIQLLDEGQIVSQVNNMKEFIFRNLPVSTYSIRILIDENGDNIWKPGNIILDNEPELIYLYPETTELKANWEISIDDISF